MTFYNVISGILFLGACQAFLEYLSRPGMFMAATLAMIMFNEAVLTSELIERNKDPVDYRLSMKFLDLGSFMTFGWALLTLVPEQNAFDANVSGALWGAGRPRAFLLLLAAYWGLTLWWNYLAGQMKTAVWRSWFLVAAHLMWLVFLLAAVYYWNAPSFAALSPWSGLALLLVIVSYSGSKLWARA